MDCKQLLTSYACRLHARGVLNVILAQRDPTCMDLRNMDGFNAPCFGQRFATRLCQIHPGSSGFPVRVSGSTPTCLFNEESFMGGGTSNDGGSLRLLMVTILKDLQLGNLAQVFSNEHTMHKQIQVAY